MVADLLDMKGYRFWCGQAKTGGMFLTGTYIFVFEAPPGVIKFVWTDPVLVKGIKGSERKQQVVRIGAIERTGACEACHGTGHHAGECPHLVQVKAPAAMTFLLGSKPKIV